MSWCCFLNSLVLFAVTVLVAILGSLVLVPFCKSVPFLGPAVGMGTCPAGTQRGVPVYPPGNMLVARIVLACVRRALLSPPHRWCCIFRGRPGTCCAPLLQIPAASIMKGGCCKPSPTWVLPVPEQLKQHQLQRAVPVDQPFHTHVLDPSYAQGC